MTPGVKYVRASTSDHDAIGFFYPISGVVGDIEHFVSPTFGANYKISPNLAAYAAFGRNIKFPDITAYYGGFQTDINGNPAVVPVTGVKPEYVNDFELGARWQMAGYSASLNYYRENFTNTFINSFSSTTGLTSVTNGGSARYQGEELQINARLADLDSGSWETHLNYSHNQAIFLGSFTTYAGATVAAGQPLADVPKDLASLQLTWSFAGWRATTEARYIGTQFIDQLSAGTPTANTISPHTLVDISLAKTLEFPGSALRSVRFALNVDNLFNKYYFNEAFTDVDFNNNNFVRAVPGAPRIVIGTVDVKF